jgi:hypothetical protein
MTDILILCALRFPTYKPSRLLRLLELNGLPLEVESGSVEEATALAHWTVLQLRSYPEWVDPRIKLLATAPNLAQAALDGDLWNFLCAVDQPWPGWPSNPQAKPESHAGFPEGEAADQARAQAAAAHRRGKRRHSRGSDQRRAIRVWVRWILEVCRDGPGTTTNPRGLLFQSLPTSFRAKVASAAESELHLSPPEKYPWIYEHSGGHVFAHELSWIGPVPHI